MSRVGEKIKMAREKSGMPAKVLAKKLGVAEKFINEVEMGRKVAPESFIDRAAKVLNVDLNDISMVVTDEASIFFLGISFNVFFSSIRASSVLKNVPIYDYSLSKNNGFKEMSVHSNKIEGYPQDKVCYLQIEDDEMSGFRIMKGDLAFAHSVKEVSNNGIFLLDYRGKRKVRQVKTLGNSKILLVSNSGSLITETMEIKEVNVIAKLERIEIKL